MNEYELTMKLRELKQLQSMIEQAKEEAEEIMEEIKAIMGEEEELRAGEYKVTWKNVTTSRVNTTALKNEHPELARQYTKKITSRRFLVA